LNSSSKNCCQPATKPSRARPKTPHFSRETEHAPQFPPPLIYARPNPHQSLQQSMVRRPPQGIRGSCSVAKPIASSQFPPPNAYLTPLFRQVPLSSPMQQTFRCASRSLKSSSARFSTPNSTAIPFLPRRAPFRISLRSLPPPNIPSLFHFLALSRKISQPRSPPLTLHQSFLENRGRSHSTKRG